jgi:CheY-like chemotaxis protein
VKTHTILVIEDHPLNFELVQDLLIVHGFNVTHASSAEEGLCLARQCLPDLVLMDLSLPGMDGLCATQRLKTDPATAAIPVVALTAHAMMGDNQLARRAGCDGYLTKPINTRTFIAEILKYLSPETCSATS